MAPKILVVDDNPELLTLLTQLFEEIGYEVLAASKGKQAVELAQTGQPQLAILDVLLPDMMGYHLADALRKDAPKLPLIFITGVFKGGKHSTEARNKYAAAGYFEKPFEAHKLTDAVKALVPPAPRAPVDNAADAFEVELDIDVEEDQPQDAMELTGRIKVRGGGELRAELRGANLTATALLKGQSVARPTPPGRAAPSDFAQPTAVAGGRRGELKDNLPSLITAFFLSNETGELGVQRGKVKKVVYFEQGQPVFALSNLVSDRFGQFLVRTGKVRAEQLQDAAAVATASKRRTGDVLIERGLLKETERMFYVGQQVKAIIYSLFGWEEGTYVMSFRDRAGAEAIKLDVHPGNLIVRGVKKLYKPERLKRLLPLDVYLTPSPQPAYALYEVDKEPWEERLLPQIDGTRTVAQLVALAQKPEATVLGFLHAMSVLNILEPRVD